MKQKDKKSINNAPVERLAKKLSTRLNLVEAEIKKNIKDQEGLITITAGHLIDAQGKKLRPLLTLLISKMLKYRGNSDINLAVPTSYCCVSLAANMYFVLRYMFT